MTRLARPAITGACLALSIAFALLMLAPALLGLHRYVITGGSMAGTIDRGSVVYARLTPVERLRVGDIVTFVPPGEQRMVTHRIIGISRTRDGRLAFQTKGDFNTAADPGKIVFSQPQQARYVYHIPYLGYALAPLGSRQVRLVVIAVPAVVLAVSLLWSIWRSAGDELRRREAADRALPRTSSGADAE